MSKIGYIVVALFLMCYNVSQIYSAPKTNAEVVIKHRIDSLEFVCKDMQTQQEITSAQLNSVQISLNSTQQICSSTVSAINTQVDGSNKLLNIWGIVISVLALLIAVAGFYLGYYIQQKAKTVKELTRQSKATEASVKRIQKNIDTNLTAIYHKLRREETLYVLNRLQQIPEDVSNCSSLLLSRELDPSDYPLLLAAYKKLLSLEEEIKKTEVKNEEDFFASLNGVEAQFEVYKSLYRVLFFQHFMGLAINEDVLRQDLIDNFKELCGSAFHNDIEKSTHELLAGLASNENQTKVEILIKYILALSTSKYNDTRLYTEIISFTDLTVLTDIWQSVSSQKQSVAVFAHSILDYLIKNNMTDSILHQQVTTYISTNRQDKTK